MTRKRRDDVEREFYKGKLTWVDVTLQLSDKEEFLKWAAKTKLTEGMLAVLEDGYQVQISWDSKSNSFLAVLKQNYAGHKDSGYAMSSRSRDVDELMQMVLYKFAVLMAGSLSDAEVPGNLGWG